jgi:iron(III) transport system substrate-binding protein
MIVGRRSFVGASALALGVLATACKRRARSVVVYTSVDQVFAAPVFRQIEAKTGVSIRAVFDTEETKSTGVLNRLLAEAERPQADVFWSGDPVRPFVLIKRGLAIPYASPGAAAVPAAFRGSDGSWTGLSARARVLLVNKTRVAGEAPRSVLDLVSPKWRGQSVIASPIFGTTTMHAAAWFSLWGADKTRAFFDDLKKNGVRVASSNGEVKRLVSAGDCAFGLTDTDDAQEAIAAGSPVELVYPDQDGMGTLVMPTSVLLLKGGPNFDEGKRLVDQLLSAEVETALTKAGAHMPLRGDVVAPAGMRRVGELRAMPADYAMIASEMEAQQPFLRKWVGL